jgi:7-cyano-7-deazaguanine synthase in queuosine biosynthesis
MITISSPDKTFRLDPVTHTLTIQPVGESQTEPIPLTYKSNLRTTPGIAPFGNTLARDLLLIGQAVLCADRAVLRGERLGKRSRSLHLSVAVEALSTWQRVQPRLEALVNFVARDRWSIAFTQAPLSSVTPIPAGNRPQPNRVCLFSDGLDSLAGAVRAIQTEQQPIFVSHSAPGFQTVNRTISRLQEQLYPGEKRPVMVANLDFWLPDSTPGGSNKLFRESTRRTRPFFYLSLAGAVALELNVPVIQLNENGVMAANIPFSVENQHISITRHAHPYALHLFEQLLNEVTESTFFSVENPSALLTKAEEVQVLQAVPTLAVATRSCENSKRQMALARVGQSDSPLRECGICVPCLIRRQSLATAGLPEATGYYLHEDRNTYMAFKRPQSGKQSPSLTKAEKAARTLLANNWSSVHDLVHFCRKINQMSPAEFIVCYLPEISLLTPSDKDSSEYAVQLYKMYQRFAKEYLVYLLPSPAAL